MLIVSGKRVIEVTFAVLPGPLFLFFRMAIMGQSDLRGRNSELGVRRSRISLCDLPKTLPAPFWVLVSPSMAGN